MNVNATFRARGGWSDRLLDFRHGHRSMLIIRFKALWLNNDLLRSRGILTDSDHCKWILHALGLVLSCWRSDCLCERAGYVRSEGELLIALSQRGRGRVLHLGLGGDNLCDSLPSIVTAVEALDDLIFGDSTMTTAVGNDRVGHIGYQIGR